VIFCSWDERSLRIRVPLANGDIAMLLDLELVLAQTYEADS
jgi:hypothetical protein